MENPFNPEGGDKEYFDEVDIRMKTALEKAKGNTADPAKNGDDIQELMGKAEKHLNRLKIGIGRKKRGLLRGLMSDIKKMDANHPDTKKALIDILNLRKSDIS